MSDPGGTNPSDGSYGSPFQRPDGQPTVPSTAEAPTASPPPDAPRFSPPAGSVWPGPTPDSGWAQPAPVQPGMVAAGPAQPGSPGGLPAGPVASTGVLAGVIVGCGVLMVLVGLYSAVHQWTKADDIYGSLDGALGGAGGSIFGGSNPFSTAVDTQRWSSLDQSLLVVGLGLLVCTGGLILRRLEQRLR